MDDPMNEDALRECSSSAGLPARPMIAAPSAISKAIRLYYGGSGYSPASSRAAAPVPVAAAAVAAGSPQAPLPATATVRSRAEPISSPVSTPIGAVATPAVVIASGPATQVDDVKPD